MLEKIEVEVPKSDDISPHHQASQLHRGIKIPLTSGLTLSQRDTQAASAGLLALVKKTLLPSNTVHADMTSLGWSEQAACNGGTHMYRGISLHCHKLLL